MDNKLVTIEVATADGNNYTVTATVPNTFGMRTRIVLADNLRKEYVDIAVDAAVAAFGAVGVEAREQ